MNVGQNPAGIRKNGNVMVKAVISATEGHAGTDTNLIFEPDDQKGTVTVDPKDENRNIDEEPETVSGTGT